MFSDMKRSKQAAVSVLLKSGRSANDALRTVLRALDVNVDPVAANTARKAAALQSMKSPQLPRAAAQTTEGLFDPHALLPAGDVNYFSYMGSQTVPPCKENVQVMSAATGGGH